MANSNVNEVTLNPSTFVCPRGFTKTLRDDFLPEADDDDELCLIRAPWDFDMSLLNGRKISLWESVVVKNPNERYFEWTPLANASTQLTNVSALIPTHREGDEIIQVPKGFDRHFAITEVLPLPDFDEILADENQGATNSGVETPQGLCQRFLPFGSDEPVVSMRGPKRSRKSSSSEVPAKVNHMLRRRERWKESPSTQRHGLTGRSCSSPDSGTVRGVHLEAEVTEPVIKKRHKRKRKDGLEQLDEIENNETVLHKHLVKSRESESDETVVKRKKRKK